jgi:hypothetical protein
VSLRELPGGLKANTLRLRNENLQKNKNKKVMNYIKNNYLCALKTKDHGT